MIYYDHLYIPNFAIGDGSSVTFQTKTSQKLPFPALSVERTSRTYVERSDWHTGVAIVFELSAAVVIGYWP